MMTTEQAAGYVSDRPVLTWALTIATYNRADILPITLRLAAEQTVPPKEIIVVDASDDWESSRAAIIEHLAPKFPNIAFRYACAAAKGAGAQRNQAVADATTDIVFVFDDDTLMYPDCAEKILAAYELDARIVGAQATNLDEAPPGCELRRENRKPPPQREPMAGNVARTGILRSLRLALARFVHRHVLLRDIDLRFVPYAGPTYPAHVLASAAAAKGLSLVPLMVGFKMTFRRDVIADTLFDASVQAASIEDFDASYRASLHGPMVSANRARVHHMWANAGRDTRSRRATVSLAHLAMCIRRYAPDPARVKYRFYIHWVRSCAAAALNDIAERDFRLPTFAGTVRALGLARRAFRADDHRLDEELEAIARDQTA